MTGVADSDQTDSINIKPLLFVMKRLDFNTEYIYNIWYDTQTVE